MTASGTEGDKADEVYYAAVDGNRVIAQHRVLPWPVAVRVPLCVVADDVVTLDLSAVAQPSAAVRWLGAGVNTKTTATAAGESTPPPVSLRVPSTACDLFSV